LLGFYLKAPLLWSYICKEHLHKDYSVMDLTPEKRAGNWLQQAGVRPTRQRLLLAELLVGDGLDRHVTAESLFAAASNGEAPVSLATVYNTLRAFCDVGLLTEVTVDGNKSYFDTRTEEHPHFYWERNGQLTDAPKDAVRIESLPVAPAGTEVSKVDIVIRLRDL
jgi:Fur family transcriptional regulator, iron response regulator